MRQHCCVVALHLLVVIGSIEFATAQDVMLNTTPRSKPHATAFTDFFVSVSVSGGFTSSIYLRATAPTLKDARLELYPAVLNFPYTSNSQLVVSTLGAKPEGRHPIIIEGYNGPLLLLDTVYITSVSNTPWRTFDMYNSQLPSNEVRSVSIAPDGVGWIGADNGLVSFDGTTWTVYPEATNAEEPGYPIGIAHDSAGGVWVSHHPNLLELRNGIWRTHDVDAREVICTPDGAVWATGYTWLKRYDGNAWTTYDASNSPIRGSGPLAFDTSGSLWLCYNGAERFDGSFWTHFDKNAMGFKTYGPEHITADSAGQIWVSSPEGIARFDTTRFVRYKATNNDTIMPGRSPKVICMGKDSTIWVVTSQMTKPGGLGRYRNGRGWFYNTYNSQLSNNDIYDIKVDRNNTLWIATRGGLVLLDGNANPDSVTVTDVEDLAVDTPRLPLSPLIINIAPNPARSQSQIDLRLSMSAHVRISVLNTLGQEVLSVCDEFFDEGARSVTLRASALPSGTYIVRAVAGTLAAIRPLIVSR